MLFFNGLQSFMYKAVFYVSIVYLTGFSAFASDNISRAGQLRMDYEARLSKLNRSCAIEDVPCPNAELEARGKLDQQARDRIHIKGDCFHGYGVRDGDDCFIIFTLVDHDNSKFIDPLLSHHGFPAGTNWSAEASQAAFFDHPTW